MANTLTWQPKALKQLEKIKDAVKRKRIYSEAQSLADFPKLPKR